MKQITAITNSPRQQFSITLDDGSIVQINSFNYVPLQQNQGVWTYSLTYATSNFSLSNQYVINSPNLLRKYRHVIPFGFCVTTLDGYEVVNQSDFVSGRANFYVLNPTDISQTETLILQTLPNFAGYPLQ